MRKQRTRQHIIEDLGFNHVERQILYAGHIIQRYTQNDYGYDGMVYTFKVNGEISTFTFHMQLKSSDQLKLSKKDESVSFDLSRRDLELWLKSTMALMLILYDAQSEVAYFTDLQAYFKEKRINISEMRKFVRIHIPVSNILTAKAIQQFIDNKIK